MNTIETRLQCVTFLLPLLLHVFATLAREVHFICRHKSAPRKYRLTNTRVSTPITTTENVVGCAHMYEHKELQQELRTS